MNKETLLHPVGYAHRDILRLQSPIERLHSTPKYGVESVALITTDQAEAYKDACVREALECASHDVHNVLHPTNPREDWTQYAYIREEAAHNAEYAIRALIPHNDNEQGE